MSPIELLDSRFGSILSPETRIAAMLEHPTLAVAVARRGRIRQINAAWRTLFALRSDISVESHLITLFPSANSAQRFERALHEELQGRGRMARVEHMLLRRDGVPFMAEVVVHPLETGDGSNTLTDDGIWQVRDITAERELRRELRELEEYYRALSTYQSDLTFVVDEKDCISFASPSVEAALGHRPSAILGEPFASLLAAEGATAGMQWLRSARDLPGGRARDSYRLRVAHHDGSVRVLSCRLRNCFDVPRIAGVVINARDVTEEAAVELAARQAQERAVRLRDRLFDLSTASISRFDERLSAVLQAAWEALDVAAASYWQVRDGGDELVCTHASLAPIDFLAVDPHEVSDPYGESFDPRAAPRYARELQTLRPIVIGDVSSTDALDEGHAETLRAAGIGALLDFPIAFDGKLVGVVSVAHAGTPRDWKSDEIDFAGGISLLVALAMESREREESSARMTYMALHDGLTGLANRTHAERELDRRIAAAGPRSVVVALVDLDQFKEVNDGHGHATGDALLVAVSAVLTEAAGPDALVARMGGDEFLIVREEMVPGAFEASVQGLIERIGHGDLVAGLEQQIGASVGVARYPADGSDAEALLVAADLAMYEAKRRGRNQSFTFDSRLADQTRLRRELEAEIQGAFASNEFCMFYQPQLDLASGKVVGLEALLRWQHPRHGLLLPEVFIAAALHRGMVDTLTRWVLGQVCEQIVSWRRLEGIELPVSVNVTARQFHDRRLPALVAAALMKSALPARLLILEITEDHLVGDEVATERVVKELARLGVRISVANFGFTFTSLDELRRLLISQVKLDRGFVGGLPGDGIGDVIVRAVVEVARRLDYQLIAEGVETHQQYEHLRSIGCDAGQGFYFGAPLSADEILGFLRDRAHGDAGGAPLLDKKASS